MQDMTARLLSAILLAGGIALASWRLRLLTPGGAAAGVLVGAAVLAFGGWDLAVMLGVFFAGSSLLTRIQAGRKAQVEHRRGRSAVQVLANGAVPATLALIHATLHPAWALPAAAGAIAASTADTWATELGMLSPVPPRLITSGAPVEAGRSGGVTVLGTLAGAAGALIIAAVADLLMGAAWAATAAGGVAGLFADSLLGATAQARYQCPQCGTAGESLTCSCGARRRRVQGFGWMTNDTVNVAAALTGAVIGGILT